MATLTTEQILQRLIGRVVERIRVLERVRLDGYNVAIAELNFVRNRPERALAYVRGANRQ